MLMDWSDPDTRPVNEYGSKARVGESKSSYSDWRRTVGNGAYANDVDWVEWRLGSDGEVEPVALIETTFYEDKPELRPFLPAYRSAVLARFKRDAQYSVVRTVAAKLDVPCYLTVVRKDLAVFFVCRLLDEKWRQMDEPAYRAWILGL